MGQVGDFTTYFEYDSSYFDPVLWHDGRQEAYTGYCSDVFTDQALQFIEKAQGTPFFCYLSFNAPHTPLQVPDEYYQRYKNIDPSEGFGEDAGPFYPMSEKNKEDARKVYAMVSNIDDNIGRVLRKLEELGVADNTLVVFMTDNGPQQQRYVAGMRGLKGSVYRGGVRVPFLVKLPGRFSGNQDVDVTAAHIDVLPTIASVCGADLPKNRVIDGQNLEPLLKGESVGWSERDLFFYWTRKYPELYNNIALLKGKYKLVGHTSYNADIKEFELFDLEKDPFEQENLVETNAELALDLKYLLDQRYSDLITSSNILHPPHIVIGSEAENPVFLNRNDAEGQRGIWAQEEIFGKWRVDIKEGYYNVRFKFLKPPEPGGRMFLEVGPSVVQQKHEQPDSDTIEMKRVYLSGFKGELIPFYMAKGHKLIFPFWVEMERVE